MKLGGVELQVDPGFEALSNDVIDTLARQVAELVHHIAFHRFLLVLQALPFVAPNLRRNEGFRQGRIADGVANGYEPHVAIARHEVRKQCVPVYVSSGHNGAHALSSTTQRTTATRTEEK